MKDEALVGRVAAGDHDAFAALYDRHAALVYGVARRMLGDGPAAEDVTQSVFLQIWSRPQMFRGGNFAGWIARVTRNACLDIVRSAAVRLRDPELPDDDVVASSQTDEDVLSKISAAAVASALALLPAEQRDPIERAYFEGLSYREVAEKLGAPVGTVKSRIRTGLHRLSELLHQAVTT
jgi:RNA polymerase sigma-70 factor, ECF subfamily